MVIPEGMLAHIRHAEGWLRRARADCGRGEARRAVLRLLLAEAEIRRARESEGGADLHPVSRPGRSLWAVLGAVAAAGVVLAAIALVRPFAPGPIATAPGVFRATPAAQRSGSILRFESGRVLPLVGFPTEARTDGRPAPGFVWSSEDLLLAGDDSPGLVTFH